MVAISFYEKVLFLSLLIFANGQNVCRDGANSIIGSDNQGEYGAEERERGRLYLNTDNPAPCSGFITELEYCYYPPESDDESRRFNFNFYRVYFAIYRQQQINGILGNVQSLYQRQTEPVLLGGPVRTLGENFSCRTFNTCIHVQEGDIIGACLPESNFLDIVGDTSDEEDFDADLSYVESGCSSIIAIRRSVNERNIEIQESRILHLYARITTNTGGEIPISISESMPPTAPAVTDQPLTEPDSNNVSIAMPHPSRFPSTSSLIGGQSSSIPTMTVVPITATSTKVIPDIQPTTSISIEASVGDQTLTITPTSTEPLMTSTSTRISTSTLEAYQSISSPIFTTHSRYIEAHLPVSTTRILTTISIVISTEQVSPSQPVTVSSRSESTLPTMTTVTAGPQNLEQGSLSTAAIVIIVVVVLAFVVLAAALAGILARKYRKRRYRYYPAFKHTILEEDESTYSQSSTIARFDNVLYSNYSETVQIQDARNSDQIYDNSDSSTRQSEPQPLENTYSEVQEKIDSDSYSYAVVSGEVNPRLPEQRPYDPNRENILSVFCAPASKESDLYAQLKLCGVKNIRRDTIEATENLGSGQFGDIKKGVWRNEKLKVPVALKTLKEGCQQVDKVKFLQEAAIMAQFSHPNVAVLYGVISKGEPIMLVVELVEKGSLLGYLAFLKENNDRVHLANFPNVLLNFSRQVALGMCYLSERGFVHRDLAARNILVSNDDICKIADFGMSRDLADENYYVSQGGKIPVKWTAPEAINYKKYSTASDVWSYGCLLYEIWSLGHKPYENLSNLQVIRHLELGQRLSPPPGCPRKIYELMILCWNPEVAFRPKFSDLALMLVGDRKEVLGIPQEDLATHPLAGVLGASLEAGEGMHLDLQNRYVFN